MKLYYALTNYHLLMCILHKLIFNKEEKAIFLASQGILKNRIQAIIDSGIFESVYYVADSELRNNTIGKLNLDYKKHEINKIANDFVKKYESLLPFDIQEIDDIYVAADHGVFGLYILIKKLPYNYFEDGRGIYSKWTMLDNLLKIKNPSLQAFATYFGAYGKSSLIKKKYVAFDSQLAEYDLTDCEDFDVNCLLEKLEKSELEKLLRIFHFHKYNKLNSKKEKNAIILTQRFATYKMLEPKECVFMYSILCDLFANDCNIFLKPHPADNCDYSTAFKNEIIIEKEFPSELLRYIIKKKFDIGLSTYSTSIQSLKNFIIDVYDIDESIVQYKKNIFKLFAIFELARKFGVNIKVDNNNTLARLFLKKYNIINDSKTVLIYDIDSNENRYYRKK